MRLIISVLQFDVTAKPAEGGSCVDDKVQSEKDWGDDKKSGVAKTPCQCECHSKTKPVTTATPAAKPAVVDLTVTPYKEESEPAHTAAQHGECKCSGPVSTDCFLKHSLTPIWLKFFSFKNIY